MTGGADLKKVTLQTRLPRAMPVWLSQKQPLWEHSLGSPGPWIGQSLTKPVVSEQENHEKSNAPRSGWVKVWLERKPQILAPQ